MTACWRSTAGAHHDFDAAVTAADELIAQARSLHHRSAPGREAEAPLIG
jgi:hypothetical protein